MCVLETLNIKVALYSVKNQNKPVYEFNSWIGSLDPSVIQQMACFAITDAVDSAVNFRTPVNEDIRPLYNGIDDAWGGDKNKIVVLTTYRDENVPNAYISEISYTGHNKPMAYLYIEFLVQEQLDTLFPDIQ